MPLYTGEVPKALDNNLGILDRFHPDTANGWIEVPNYIQRLRFTRRACIATEIAISSKYGESYIGARAALVIARQIVEEEIGEALRAISHRQDGGCAEQECSEACYNGLNAQKLRFHFALVICARQFAEEAPEL